MQRISPNPNRLRQNLLNFFFLRRRSRRRWNTKHWKCNVIQPRHTHTHNNNQDDTRIVVDWNDLTMNRDRDNLNFNNDHKIAQQCDVDNESDSIEFTLNRWLFIHFTESFICFVSFCLVTHESGKHISNSYAQIEITFM